MSTKFESGTIVDDKVLTSMKPTIEGNAKVEHAGTGYIFMMYVENDPYTHDSYWTGYESGLNFDSDEEAIAYLHELKNKQVRPNHPDTYKKCELLIRKTLKTEERIVLED